jgi:predicted amidohydrolase YtcJ
MKTSRLAPWLFLLLAVFSVSAMTRAEDVDVVLTNGNIYTVNEKQPKAEAVAVKSDHIVFVGSNEDVKKFHSAKVVDLNGRAVLPGLTDSHCHIFGIGEREMRLNLEGTDTLDSFLSKVKARVAQTPRGKWIVGRGWIETFWKPPKFPTRQELDKIAPGNPVFLTRADGHASVANSAALKIANIDRNTPDPFGGQILKTNGEPNGMLLDNAQELVEKNIPQPSHAEREEALLRGISREIGLGWCEIQNAGSHKDDVDLIKKVYVDGKAKIRFINCVTDPGKMLRIF